MSTATRPRPWRPHMSLLQNQVLLWISPSLIKCFWAKFLFSKEVRNFILALHSFFTGNFDQLKICRIVANCIIYFRNYGEVFLKMFFALFCFYFCAYNDFSLNKVFKVNLLIVLLENICSYSRVTNSLHSYYLCSSSILKYYSLFESVSHIFPKCLLHSVGIRWTSWQRASPSTCSLRVPLRLRLHFFDSLHFLNRTSAWNS